MATVRLGNRNPQMQVPGGAANAEHINQSVTSVHLWDGIDDPQHVDHSLSTNNDRVLTMVARGLGKNFRRYAIAIAEIEQILAVHSGGEAPTWVDSDDPNLAKAVAQHFDCHLGEPLNILTTVGRDALHAQHLGGVSGSAQPAQFQYMALSANTTAVSAANTTLPGEITTAGGGLVRAQATYAHTGSTNTTTLTKTFTANGSDSLSVVIAKIGIFNAASTGTLGYETMLNATATLTTSGDNVTVTWTDTIG